MGSSTGEAAMVLGEGMEGLGRKEEGVGWSGSRRKRVRAEACAGSGAHTAAGRSGACSLTFPSCYGHDGVCLTTLRPWPKAKAVKGGG